MKLSTLDIEFIEQLTGKHAHKVSVFLNPYYLSDPESAESNADYKTLIKYLEQGYTFYGEMSVWYTDGFTFTYNDETQVQIMGSAEFSNMPIKFNGWSDWSGEGSISLVGWFVKER